MLAARRDQENILRGQHLTAKSQQKSHNTQGQKTPLKLDRNNENAPTVIKGKSVARGGGQDGVDKPDKISQKQNQLLRTPMTNGTRAPLGNKTTNANTTGGKPLGSKSIIRGNESHRQQPNTTRKLRQNILSTVPSFQVQYDSQQLPSQDDEPEYAPLNPTALGYQSDILPSQGLTFNGLKRENMLKGYYRNFHNPVAENGIPSREARLQTEIDRAIREAEDSSIQQASLISWHTTDVAAIDGTSLRKPIPKTHITGTSTEQKKTRYFPRPPVATTKAVAVGPRLNDRPVIAKHVAGKASLSASSNPLQQDTVRNTRLNGFSVGETASHSSIGYRKGRCTSALLQREKMPRSNENKSIAEPGQTAQNSTLLPPRSSQVGCGKGSNDSHEQPVFTSIFVDYEEDEDIALTTISLPSSTANDEEEEEFELAL